MPRFDQTARHPRNKTKYASLDKLAADPRIVEIWDEDEDGIWAQLAPGYNFEGCSCLHGIKPFPGEPGSALKNLMADAKSIKKGDPY